MSVWPMHEQWSCTTGKAALACGALNGAPHEKLYHSRVRLFKRTSIIVAQTCSQAAFTISYYSTTREVYESTLENIGELLIQS